MCAIVEAERSAERSSFYVAKFLALGPAEWLTHFIAFIAPKWPAFRRSFKVSHNLTVFESKYATEHCSFSCSHNGPIRSAVKFPLLLPECRSKCSTVEQTIKMANLHSFIATIVDSIVEAVMSTDHISFISAVKLSIMSSDVGTVVSTEFIADGFTEHSSFVCA